MRNRQNHTLQCAVKEGEQGRDALRHYLTKNERNNPFAQTVLQQLDDRGYCILRGLFTAAECDDAAS